MWTASLVCRRCNGRALRRARRLFVCWDLFWRTASKHRPGHGCEIHALHCFNEQKTFLLDRSITVKIEVTWYKLLFTTHFTEQNSFPTWVMSKHTPARPARPVSVCSLFSVDTRLLRGAAWCVAVRRWFLGVCSQRSATYDAGICEVGSSGIVSWGGQTALHGPRPVPLPTRRYTKCRFPCCVGYGRGAPSKRNTHSDSMSPAPLVSLP